MNKTATSYLKNEVNSISEFSYRMQDTQIPATPSSMRGCKWRFSSNFAAKAQNNTLKEITVA
jgi:hypothetical protein